MDGPTRHSFGYGSNMSLNALRVKGITPLSSVPARLDGYKRSFKKGSGMAVVVEDPESCVFGVVHTLTEADARLLDEKEGKPFWVRTFQTSISPTGLSISKGAIDSTRGDKFKCVR